MYLYINEYHSMLKESYGNTNVKQNKPGVERQIIIDSYAYYKNISLVRNIEWRGWQDGSMSDGLNSQEPQCKRRKSVLISCPLTSHK